MSFLDWLKVFLFGNLAMACLFFWYWLPYILGYVK